MTENIKRYILTAILLSMVLTAAASAVTYPTIYKWDLRLTYSWTRNLQYDTHHMAVGLQGLANREAPRVFLIFDDNDEIWFNRITEEGGVCHGWNVVNINNIQHYIELLSPYADGVVLYDQSPDTGVISTSLVATSAAAAQGCIALRNDPNSGVYKMLVTNSTGPQLPVKIDLTGKFTGSGTIWGTSRQSTGSAKCDAYIWLVENYIKQGKCDPAKLVYNMDLWGLKPEVRLDHAQLRNLDYAFSRKAVCFELSPWGDEPATDDPGQPVGTDLETFKEILDECNVQTGQSEMIKFCGFVNWAYKYTDYASVGGSHPPVASEWEIVRVISAYNAYMEGDALDMTYVSNTSFYNGLKPALSQNRYVQNPAPGYQDLVDRGFIDSAGNVVDNNYIMMYLGDYDQVSWMLYWLGCDRWQDAQRGNVYCNWALTPNSFDRAGVAMDYMYRTKSERDFFTGGDTGAGYIHPSQLYGQRYPSGYSSGVDIWQKHCEDYYRIFDYSITAWMLNAGSGPLKLEHADMYAPFSGDGIGFNDDLNSPILRSNVPVIERNGPDIYNDNIQASALGITPNSGVNFHWYRSILLYPNKLKELEDECNSLGYDYQFVDAFTFYYLLRHHLGGNNHYRASWTGDDIPDILETSQTYPARITVRNDGWDSWSRESNYWLAYTIVPRGVEPEHADYDSRGRFGIAEGTVVNSGESFTFDVDIAAPSQPGEYDIYYDMVRDGITWFSVANNIEWKQPLTVVDDVYTVDTDGDGMPDVTENEYGLLFWHPDDGVCGDAGYLEADVSGADGSPDCYVDINDIKKCTWYWLSQDQDCDITGPQLSPDGVVNIYDIAVIASQWLRCNDPQNINCW
ncbi:GxGYxYP domain-containing protein [Limihaloglobus sulfuriphilus]|nr:GxGYxYP domain-containing protein [Limihaloglobus sulfuriphilus]